MEKQERKNLNVSQKKAAEKKTMPNNQNPDRNGRETEKDRPEAGYREIYRKIELPFNQFGFGDEYLFFEGPDGRPKYKNVNEPWDNFIQWLETIRERLRAMENFVDNCEYRVGQEIIKYAKERNTHLIYMMMKTYWVEFRDTYLLVEDCPEYVLEFVRGVMHKRMTEKQMWGTREDRMPEGKVIVFDKKFMPEEGEDTGKLEFEYQPINFKPKEKRDIIVK